MGDVLPLIIVTVVLLIVLYFIGYYSYSAPPYNSTSTNNNGQCAGNNLKVVKPTLILFYASWCGACIQFTKPNGQGQPSQWSQVQTALKNQHIHTLEIDCTNPEVAKQFCITSFPTLKLLLPNGQMFPLIVPRNNIPAIVQWTQSTIQQQQQSK